MQNLTRDNPRTLHLGVHKSTYRNIHMLCTKYILQKHNLRAAQVQCSVHMHAKDTHKLAETHRYTQ